MRDVNGWLMALSFLLGLLLTFAMMIRRVTREVPVGRTAVQSGVAKAAPAVAAAAKVGEKLDRVEKKAEQAVTTVERSVKGAAATIGADAEHILEKDPYGPGSVRVTERARKTGWAPAGYTIKGDKDTGRFFTVGSPQYAEVEAEVWFADEQSAAKAGFLRWDASADRNTGLTETAAAAVISEERASADTVITEIRADADATMVIVESPTGQTDTTLRFVSGPEEGKPRRA